MTEANEPVLPEGLDKGLDELGLYEFGGERLGGETAAARRGRAFSRNRGAGMSALNLVNQNGILRWQVGADSSSRRAGGRAGRASVPMGQIVKRYAFTHEGENEIASFVRRRENKMFSGKDGNEGKADLWRLDNSDEPKFSERMPDNNHDGLAGKKMLLFIHGTFSHCDTTCSQIHENDYGTQFLVDARDKNYDMVLAFNHPTLSVSPMVNAFRLAALLRTNPDKRPKQIDIICHSRGGVVARWFTEGFADQGVKYRVAFVACPLGGTSLASASHLRAGSDLLANYASVVGKSDILTGNGILIVGAILARISSWGFKGLAKLPVFDIATAVVPGLMGQARVGENYELETLHSSGAFESQRKSYFALTSNFAPPRIEKWKFYKVFTDPANLAMNWAEKGSDHLIFVDRKGDDGPVALANDVVVDTMSMTELRSRGEDFLTKKPIKRVGMLKSHTKIFKGSDQIHHNNYFSHPETFEAFRKWFGMKA